MIQIIDKSTGQRYDLPAGMKISVLETQPLLTTQGSITLQTALEYTDNNLRILDFPHRYDRRRKYMAKREVIIMAGSFQLVANMVVTSAQKYQPIKVTFLLDEGEINNRIKDATMEGVFGTMIFDIFYGSTAEKVVQCVDYMDRVMCGDKTEEFHVFPVCTEFNETEYHDFLNHVAVPTNNGLWTAATKTDRNGNAYYRLSAYRTYSVSIDGKTIDFPIGYGVTPFLKLSVVLRRLFNYFGFNLQESLFDTDPDLKKMVVLNNTVDAILKGVFNYGQLVPNCTVTEFLDAIRYKFGCDFFLQKDNVSVKVVFWNDILSNTNYNNVSQKINMYPVAGYEKQKTVKLTQKKSINASNYYFFVNSYESYQAFKKIFPNVTPKQTYSETQTAPVGVYFAQNYLLYVQRRSIIDSGQEYLITDTIGQDGWDYFEENDELETMEYQSTDDYVPIVRAFLSAKWKSSTMVPRVITPFVDKVRQKNSVIQYSDNTTNEDKVGKDCPIMFCYAHGRAVAENNNANVERCFYGTTYSFNNAGVPNGNLHLVYGGDKGLYHRFWERFDNVLRHSFQPVQTNLNLDTVDIMRYDKTQPDLIDGQPLLMESMKYEISDTGVRLIEINYRTIKKYED
ncbi:hypothetical protein D0T49_03950 [Paludibacter sp. 221]|uniref:hypothetical protein n=1 Tax=Paludibacter sp. 221 TaxID=2302939 RepID=UPI0013D430FC|nr:hypothetical protein [Paludibacter sp. 221]NDV46194.1 hypothetical protein [Paludibacter sp. 221]